MKNQISMANLINLIKLINMINMINIILNMIMRNIINKINIMLNMIEKLKEKNSIKNNRIVKKSIQINKQNVKVEVDIKKKN